MRHAERRSLERFPLEMPARIRRVQSSSPPNTGGAEMEGLTRDISSGGAFIKGGQPFAMGAEVTIQLIMPLDKFKALQNVKNVRIHVSGIIARTESDGFGIRFNEQYEITPNNK